MEIIVGWSKDDVECSFSDAKKIKSECENCKNVIYRRFQEREWKCSNCGTEVVYYGIIYKAKSRYNEKVYIGQTTMPLRTRILTHMSKKKPEKKRSQFERVISKYGADNFDWSIVDYVKNDDEDKDKLQEILNEKEIEWIRKLNSFVGWEDAWGYNSTTGGKQTRFSKESVEKRSGENHGRSKLTAGKVKVIKLLLRDTGMYLKEIGDLMGVSLDAIFDIKNGSVWDKVEINDEEKLEKEYANYPKDYPRERKKPFYAFIIGSCEFVGEFVTQSECAKILDINKSDLNAVLKNRRQVAGEYSFIYKAEYNEKWKRDVLAKLKNNRGKEFFVYNFLTGQSVNKYSNIYDCADELNLEFKSISACLNKKRTYHEDYIFIYKEEYGNEIVEELVKKAKNNRKYAPQSFLVYNFLTGKYVKEYSNQRECAKDLLLKHKSISLCLLKKCTYHGDYVFIYKEEYGNEIVEELIEKAKKNAMKKRVNFHVYNFNTGNYIKNYTSVQECANDLVICKQGISDCIRNRRTFVKDYVFVNNEQHKKEIVAVQIEKALKNKRYSKCKKI